MHLIVRTDAEAQIASGYGWYEEQRRGLGAEFVEELSFTYGIYQPSMDA